MSVRFRFNCFLQRKTKKTQLKTTKTTLNVVSLQAVVRTPDRRTPVTVFCLRKLLKTIFQPTCFYCYLGSWGEAQQTKTIQDEQTGGILNIITHQKRLPTVHTSLSFNKGILPQAFFIFRITRIGGLLFSDLIFYLSVVKDTVPPSNKKSIPVWGHRGTDYRGLYNLEPSVPTPSSPFAHHQGEATPPSP